MRRKVGPRGRLGVVLVGLATVLALGAGSALADPIPGDNGAVKVDGVVFDTAPDNQPHVGCTFQIDFYGYDQGAFNATVKFELQSPTGSGLITPDSGSSTVFIGGDPAGGGTDLDGQETYTLPFGLPQHPIQGTHVKLTVNAPFSIGADTKYKVFWVTGCEYPS